jgi:flagellar motor switch/type III secretory pathway protein FliN
LDQKGYWTCIVFEVVDQLAMLLNRTTLDRLPPPADIELQLDLLLYRSKVKVAAIEGFDVGDVFTVPMIMTAKPALLIGRKWKVHCEIDAAVLIPGSRVATISLAQLWQGKSLISLGVPIRDDRDEIELNNWKIDMSDSDLDSFNPAELEVDLQFMAGSVRVPFGELGQIGPGYVFNLKSNVGEPITVLANGRPIAVGELVSIQGELGVRVLRTARGL